jgi:hypothetical protein
MKLAAGMMSLLLGGMLIVGPAVADPPEGKGGGKHENAGHADGQGKNRSGNGPQDHRGSGHEWSNSGADSSGPAIEVNLHFDDRQRRAVHEYYTAEYGGGHCPPGLAKKNNGCMPPGQAKKWSRGRPLPPDVVFHDVPPELVVEIGVPPPGYEYVRVAADILLIATGTRMVIDAITDLGNL